MRYLYSVADYPVYYNTSTGKYEVYSSTSINGKKLHEADTQSIASDFCRYLYNSIYSPKI